MSLASRTVVEDFISVVEKLNDDQVVKRAFFKTKPNAHTWHSLLCGFYLNVFTILSLTVVILGT